MQIVFELVLLFTGIYFFLDGIAKIDRGNLTKKWPSVRGSLIDADIEADLNGTYYVNIMYRYSVDGIEFTSNKYTIDESNWESKVEAELIVKEYRALSFIEIYYNPANPTEAVLIRGASNQFRSSFLTAILFFLTATIVIAGGSAS